MKCEDIEVCIERLMVIDTANMEEYTKEINTMTSDRARLNREVAECVLLAHKEASPIPRKYLKSKTRLRSGQTKNLIN